MISKSNNFNENYAAQIIQVKNLRPVPNADRLMMFTFEGMNIITSKATREGDIVIYFPVECKINAEFLRLNSQFRDKTLNANQDVVGFFEPSGRVKALKLRGQPSEGFIMPVASLNGFVDVDIDKLDKNESFDTIGGKILVEKYVVRKYTKPATSNRAQKGVKAKRLESKLVDNQFKFHYSTPKLAANLHTIGVDSVVTLTWKMHGTSFVSSNVLCKRKLTLIDKIAKFFGANIKDTEYDNIYSSRKVIKNEYLNPNASHFYKTDIWGKANDKLKDQLLKGESVYGEIVGYTDENSFIQKGYDYGCSPGHHMIYVYRITHTNEKGNVIELPYNQMQERCEQLGVKAVPLIFSGRAIDLHNLLLKSDQDDSFTDWRHILFENIKSKYVYDQDSKFCKNVVPEEGVVLKVDKLSPTAFKLKSSRFLRHESKLLDENIVDIEEDQ